METSGILLTISILLLVIAIFTNYLQKIYYWKQQNIQLFSGIKMNFNARKKHLSVVMRDMYQTMHATQEPFRVVPSVVLTTVLVQDLLAVRDIMLTHFESFSDRGGFVNHRDPLSLSVVTMSYDMWKPTRQKFTPAFTPAKLKMMFPTLSAVGEHLVDVIRNRIESGINVMDVEDLSARFTTDVIGNVAFGVKCNSLQDPNTAFRMYGDQAADLNIHPILHILGGKYPKVFKLFNVKTFRKEITEFFTGVVRETMEYRETHNVRHNDFMDVLMELKKSDDNEFSLTLEMIVAQVFVFFVAGFGTSSATISYALYELAKNQEVQKKVRKEIQDILKQNENKLTYESLQDMVYLQQVIKETLRMYPVVPNLRRMCRHSCTLKSATGPHVIPSGTFMLIPVYGIHHNPEFYPQPWLFRPERFAENEMHKRPDYSYLPFGVGPRACMGLRFAKMQVAFCLALLLNAFHFSMSKKTPKELLFNPKIPVFLTIIGGINLKIQKL